MILDDILHPKNSIKFSGFVLGTLVSMEVRSPRLCNLVASMFKSYILHN